ncbi:MAG: GAF domain-containing protein, partial [Anaerolineae bacterium]
MPKRRKKKQLDNRLEKLFDEIKENGTATPPEERITGQPPTAPARASSKAADTPPPADTRRSASLLTGPLPAPEPRAIVGRGTPDSPAAMALAFRVDENQWATLQVVDEEKPRVWDSEEQALVRQVADQLSLALENARLFQETQRHARELAVLNEMGRVLTSLLDINSVLEQVYEYASRLLDTTNFYIALYDADNDTISFPLAYDKGERQPWQARKARNGLTEYVIRTCQPLLLAENATERLQELGVEAIGTPAESWLGVPMLAGEKVTGVIAVQDYEKPHAFDEHDRDLLESIASQAAIALENARLFQETRQRSEELAAINEIIASASRSLDMDEILETVLEQLVNALGMSGGLANIADEDGNLRLRRWYNIPQPLIDHALEHGLGNTPCEYVYQTGHPLALEDVEKAPPGVDASGLLENNIHVYLGAPIEARGKVLGTFCILNDAPIRISDEMVWIVQSVGRQVGFAVENARLFERTQQQLADLRLLSEISQKLASAPLNLAQIADTVSRIFVERMDVPEASVSLLEDDGDTMTIIADYYQGEEGEPELVRDPTVGTTWKLSDFPASKAVIESGQPRIIQANDPQADPAELAYMRQYDVQTLAIFPLISKGQSLGLVELETDRPTPFTPEQIDLALTIANQAAVALENARLFEQTEASAAELRALFAAMIDVIIVYDKEGRYTRIAPTNPSRLFRPPEEMLGKSIREVLPPETHEPFMNAIQQALKTGEPVNLEYPLEIEGNEYWFYATITKLDEDHVFWVARDITERKHAEARIQRQRDYLETASEISRLITSTLNLDTLFRQAVNLIQDRFGYYHVGIFVVEETGFNAVLAEATGEAGEEMKRRKHSLAVGSNSIIGQVTATGKPLVVNNTAVDTVHRPNPLLPETRAEAALPLRIGDRILGALDIQADKVDAFSPEDLAVLQSLADQIAVAIDNARSYEVAQQHLKEMRELDKLKSQFLA